MAAGNEFKGSSPGFAGTQRYPKSTHCQIALGWKKEGPPDHYGEEKMNIEQALTSAFEMRWISLAGFAFLKRPRTYAGRR